MPGLLRACELLEPECLVQMLKAVKHLSMNQTLLDVLQNANAIEILTKILDEQSTGSHSTVSHGPPVVVVEVVTFSENRKCQITFSRRVIISAA